MNTMAKLYILIIQFAVMLGVMGSLKDATLAMAGHAAKAQRGMISYSKFTRMLVGPVDSRKSHSH